MNNKIKVLAQSFDPESGEPLGKARWETIDIKKNALFKGCKTLTDVAEKYMYFWNRLPTIQREMVLVRSLREVE